MSGSFPPFGENVNRQDGTPVFVWELDRQVLISYDENGAVSERPFTEEERTRVAGQRIEVQARADRETSRKLIKAIVTDLKLEKDRVDLVINKPNASITGADTKDVARAAKRIADAALELAKFVQNI